jgi:lipoprotein-anchoring transpeptidase ErfK/SrfK
MVFGHAGRDVRSNSRTDAMASSRSLPKNSAFLALFAVVLGFSSAADAQSSTWDWGGEKKVDGSGRELVQMAAAKKSGDIIVSFSDRKLYFVTKPGEALSYPIAIPREQSRWQGMIAVTSKRENPSWTPTPTMRVENPKLPSWVPGGHPMNPLGIRALYLGSSTYRIHGTDAPWTIGSAVSKGCVRMYNQDVVDLYPRVRVGAAVMVTWDKFKTTADPDAKISAVEDADHQRPKRRTADSTPAQGIPSVQTGSAASPVTARDTGNLDEPKSSRVDISKFRARLAPKRPEAPAVKKYQPPEELAI